MTTLSEPEPTSAELLRRVRELQGEVRDLRNDLVYQEGVTINARAAVNDADDVLTELVQQLRAHIVDCYYVGDTRGCDLLEAVVQRIEEAQRALPEVSL